jgi:hypothetical protein
VDQNQIELCFTDNLDNFVAASCTTLQRKRRRDPRAAKS